MEHTLFEIFESTCGKALRTLESARAQQNDELWREAAHSWKGACMNLGADRLRELCLKAERISTSNRELCDQFLADCRRECDEFFREADKLQAA